MRATLFTRLGMTGVVTEYSQAVSMEGANAVSIDLLVFALSGTGTPTVTVTLQLSNDLENWSNATMSGNTKTSIGYSLIPVVSAVPTAYVRLMIGLSGTSPAAVLSAGLNTSSL